MTEEESRELMARLFGTSREMELSPFEYGWTARAILTPEEQTQGRSIGLGMYIIDQDGTVTAHSSRPPMLIVKEYIEARRQGRKTGGEVWPNPVPDNRPTTVDPRFQSSVSQQQIGPQTQSGPPDA